MFDPELMEVDSRNAAQEASAEIFWIYQKIEPGEVNTAKAHNIPDVRVVPAKQGGGSYLLHAMFLCGSSCEPSPLCGLVGDIWISEPQIYVHTATTWTIASMENANRTIHPFLVPSTIRQHRGKWKQQSIDETSHPGVTELVQREDLKAIIETQYHRLSSGQISHYLSAILPCFLDDQTPESQQVTSSSSAPYASIQPDSLNPDRQEDDSQLSLSNQVAETSQSYENECQPSDEPADSSQVDTPVQSATDKHSSAASVHDTMQSSSNMAPTCNAVETSETVEHEGNSFNDAKSTSKQYQFFNRALIAATPMLDISGVSEETMKADEKLVQWMSTGQDATASSNIDGEEIPPIVQVLEYPTHTSLQEKMRLSEIIHGVLASGRAVALVPATANSEIEWNAENIGYLLTGIPGDCSTVVNWQSTRKRHIEHQRHQNPTEKSYWIDLCQKGTMKEFLNAVEAQDEPINCLDAPQAAGYAPEIVNLLANDCHAWNITNTIEYTNTSPTVTSTEHAFRPKTKSKKALKTLKAKGREEKQIVVNDLSDLSDLTSLTSGEEGEEAEEDNDLGIRKVQSKGTYRSRVGAKRKGQKKDGNRITKRTKPLTENNQTLENQTTGAAGNDIDRTEVSSKPFEFKYSGIRGEGTIMVERDVDRMRRWMLLGSSQFYTYPHHDAAGLVTWTRLLNGLKIWSYILPKKQPKNLEQSSKVYTEIIQSLHHIGSDTENRLPALATAHNLFLFPGTLLHPPGLIHQVLTVKNSVTQGGHLLTWNTMHLTEWTRKLSHNCFRVGTNDLHPGVQRTLGRMMIALSIRGPTKVLKKPFMSLARLIVYADQYWRGDYELNDESKLPFTLKAPSKRAERSQMEAWNERVEAANIAKAILRWNGIEDLKPLIDIDGQSHDALGFIVEYTDVEENISWSETGSDVLYIPKFPQL
ncbi:hypothetical protein BDY19DRAFT_998365 [Irpex rosettiformis]|uniref:Uncharacterized protein n=1 Tax=Irpex rosettiformis TaxID=378272 RepID=A0ACB8TNV9_9APHY|nr:hypothetical protein BDY19DRAFT_998365 [Irpex rosettiformis]